MKFPTKSLLDLLLKARTRIPVKIQQRGLEQSLSFVTKRSSVIPLPCARPRWWEFFFFVQFYSELKSATSDEYRRSSYLAARAAIQRHIRVLKRPFNIFMDEAFAYFNKVLKSVLIAHKKAGEEPEVRQKAGITDDDLEKLKGYFVDVLDEKSPNAAKSCEYFWFMITSHLCLRASEI